MDITIRRFDQDLFGLDTTDMEAGLARLHEEYPEFSSILLGQILGIESSEGNLSEEAAFVKGFIQDPAIRHLYDTTQAVFPKLSDIESDFDEAFRFFEFYFPEEPTPTVTAFISEYSIAAFVYGENDLAIGLDFFLGENYPYMAYNPGNPNFSAYMTRTFNKAHLVSKALQALVGGLADPPPGNRLLDMMIHNGKKLYVLDHLLPYAPDSIKMEVTAEQMNWLEDNELEMWAYFLKENLLYSSNWQDIRKYVDYSPNSPGMPPEAPGRTANWLGWQIVKAYMKRQPETTMPQLFALADAQKLLDESKYKPGR
ncbi:MAG: hypothetical protein KDC66_21365 [Phaeodactylibacter sp.]|nr:hypothetical protein [Phaeodactylibacter sp.]MCB9273785.1 hypothetical protein [Lewinellaceae bacterium]